MFANFTHCCSWTVTSIFCFSTIGPSEKRPRAGSRDLGSRPLRFANGLHLLMRSNGPQILRRSVWTTGAKLRGHFSTRSSQVRHRDSMLIL